MRSDSCRVRTDADLRGPVGVCPERGHRPCRLGLRVRWRRRAGWGPPREEPPVIRDPALGSLRPALLPVLVQLVEQVPEAIRDGLLHELVIHGAELVADTFLAAAVEFRIGCKLFAGAVVETDPSELVPLINRHIRPLAT